MSDKPLLDWLERRKESSVIVKARQHIGKVLDTAVDLDRALGFQLSGRRDEIPEALHRVEMDEKAADNLEVSIFEELSRGDMDPKEREDLMRLVRRIDDIADWFKVAGRNLELIVETGAEDRVEIEIGDEQVFLESLSAGDALALLVEDEGLAIEDQLVLAPYHVDEGQADQIVGCAGGEHLLPEVALADVDRRRVLPDVVEWCKEDAEPHARPW